MSLAVRGDNTATRHFCDISINKTVTLFSFSPFSLPTCQQPGHLSQEGRKAQNDLSLIAPAKLQVTRGPVTSSPAFLKCSEFHTPPSESPGLPLCSKTLCVLQKPTMTSKLQTLHLESSYEVRSLESYCLLQRIRDQGRRQGQGWKREGMAILRTGTPSVRVKNKLLATISSSSPPETRGPWQINLSLQRK